MSRFCTRRLRRTLAIIMLSICVLAPAGCSITGRDRGAELQLGLHGVDYDPQKPESWVMPNGLTVMYLHDDELPIVRGGLYTQGGSFWEAEDKRGVVSVMGDQLRQGGAGDLSADALDRELERLAAGISTNFSTEFGRAAFFGLHTDLDRVFALFADVLLRPRFEADRLDLWRGQALEAIRRRTDDPGTIASLSFNQLVYGDTVYGRVTVDKDVRAIDRSDLLEAHARFVVPQRSILVMSGKVDKDKVMALAERHFGSWKPAGGDLPPAPAVSNAPTPGIYFLSYPFAQSTIIAGQLGPQRLSPDFPAIKIFNEVFGSSGFSARLTRRVRTELGLAYGVYGGIMPGRQKGVALVQLQTKAPSTGFALVESLRVLRGIQQAPITSEELAEAQRSITNSFVFKFDSTEDLLQRAALLRMLEYPADYDANYVDRIKAVEPEEVQTVAQKRWNPNEFVVVVVGNETAYTALEAALEAEGGGLSALPLKRVRFDQRLLMP